MPSPFPGMNPYFEREGIWNEFHGRLIYAIADVLLESISPRYIARVEERLFIREIDSSDSHFLGQGDVSVVPGRNGGRSESAVAVTDASMPVRLPRVDVEKMRYIEIHDRNEQGLVTVIEVLRPSNKYSGPDREQYLSKRAAVLHSSVHFVEIDLLRGGPRMPMEDLAPCDYCILVSRAEARPVAGVRPIFLCERLPKISIPLRAEDADALIELQEILHRVYDAGHYSLFLYDEPPKPKLKGADTDWAAEILRKAIAP